MNTFLGEVAKILYKKYGDDIQNIKIVLPTKRSGIFFNNDIINIAGKPLWQPNYISVDDIMQEISGIKKTDSINLLIELYKIYKEKHRESFDSFYYWGEILLDDFDSIDKYLINAKTLFINIAELKKLENNISYLSEDQIKIIKLFWSNFNPDDISSTEKLHFVNVWNTLFEVYKDFKCSLEKKGVAYTGMLYRKAVENIRNSNIPEKITNNKYAIIGFNALSECEKVLFDYLQSQGLAEFFWDYDNYYTKNLLQESGTFLRDNIQRYPSLLYYGFENFSKPKEITVVSAPSQAMEAKYTFEFIDQLTINGSSDEGTAIVLTDERLLIPVINSIPDGIRNINITMGYPFKLTLAYSFLEKLISLQMRKKNKNDKSYFYHKDVKNIIQHPYYELIDEKFKKEFLSDFKQIYIPIDQLVCINGLEKDIFIGKEGWKKLSEYFINIFEFLYSQLKNYSDRDIFLLLLNKINEIKNSLQNCALELSDRIFFSILKKTINNIRISFEGEPLMGLQIMGILETRNLDFKNVLILSANDDNFPGNMSAGSSYIPYSLRVGYGLPTPQHHEGVYAYYFYRLLQRAENVTIVYSSKADDRNTGEPSRYIYQLDYESPHKINYQDITLNVNLGGKILEKVDKSDDIIVRLKDFLTDGNKGKTELLSGRSCGVCGREISNVGRYGSEEGFEDGSGSGCCAGGEEKVSVLAPVTGNGIGDSSPVSACGVCCGEVSNRGDYGDVSELCGNGGIVSENEPYDNGDIRNGRHKCADVGMRNDSEVVLYNDMPPRCENTNGGKHKSVIAGDKNVGGDEPGAACGADGANFTDGRPGKRILSPSAFNVYLECPMKFYYRSVAGLSEDDEPAEEVDLPMFGNILHKATEIIYGSIKGDPSGAMKPKKRFGEREIKEVVDRAVCEEYFKEAVSPDEFGGNIAIVRDIIVKYLWKNVLEHDAKDPGFTVLHNELWVNSTIEAGGRVIRLGGKIDRLDRLSDGRLRIVDYKTGAMKQEFSGIEALFSSDPDGRNPAALQTLIYSYMVKKEYGTDVVPALYYVRHMNKEGYDPCLVDTVAGVKLTSYSDVAEEFETELKRKLEELFDPAVPFRACRGKKTCEYCEFKAVCG